VNPIPIDFPTRPFGAYLFDCDGTLVDSMPLHYQAWCRTLADHHADQHFPEALFYRLGGVTTAEIVDRLNRQHGLSMNAAEVAAHKENHYLTLLDALEPIEPVIQFADTVRQTSPVAVVSGGTRHVVETTLEKAGIRDWFQTVVTPADVANGKPAPDLFLKAAENLGTRPEDCVVFEDGLNGIEGARRAGMTSVFIPSQPESVRAAILEEARLV